MTHDCAEAGLLGPAGPAPVGLRNAEARSPFLLICDHAGNAVSEALRGLRPDAADLARHIAVDVGALGVASGIADLLGAPLVRQRYSRLVIECNRTLASRDSIAAESDGTVVPGNQGLDATARRRRVTEIFKPYHAETGRRLDARRAAGLRAVLVSIHSFTPSLAARPGPRPWHVGICHGADGCFASRVFVALAKDREVHIGRNEPYGIEAGQDYSILTHGEGRGLPYVEFEIRQDLIADEAGQAEWARRLSDALVEAERDFPDP